MVQSLNILKLEEFLKLPETKPASEFIAGQTVQKTMPQGKHSRLQFRLCNAISETVELKQLGMAFPELRCTFDGRSRSVSEGYSIVPDVAVFRWQRIPFDPNGEISNSFMTYPDWTIEILSPEQSPTKTIGKILHCLDCGTQLGWLVDPAEKLVICFSPKQQPIEIIGDLHLPIPDFLELNLTATQMFSWLIPNS
jgi:Uma2 family endonuclease